MVVVLNDESVLGNANGLDPRMKDIIDGWHISLLSNPLDLIKETIGYEARLACGNKHRILPPHKAEREGQTEEGLGTRRTIQTILPYGSSSFPIV